MRAVIASFALAACATASAQIAPLPMALCAGWEGERVCEVLQEDAQIRVLRCTFPPGVGHEMHYHPPHLGYVLEGNSVMRITTASGVVDRPVRAGTSFSNDAKSSTPRSTLVLETTLFDRREEVPPISALHRPSCRDCARIDRRRDQAAVLSDRYPRPIAQAGASSYGRSALGPPAGRCSCSRAAHSPRLPH
jgi:hypothetical protein